MHVIIQHKRIRAHLLMLLLRVRLLDDIDLVQRILVLAQLAPNSLLPILGLTRFTLITLQVAISALHAS